MAFESLQAIVGNAVIDKRFRCTLLGESRLKVISDFNLTGEETEAVMAIQAETLEQFASQVHSWIMKKEGQVEPPILITSVWGPTIDQPEPALHELAPSPNIHLFPAWVS
jgi:hypothetical protein